MWPDNYWTLFRPLIGILVMRWNGFWGYCGDEDAWCAACHKAEWTLQLCCLLGPLQSCLLLSMLCHSMSSRLLISLLQDCWACAGWPHLCRGRPPHSMLKLFIRRKWRNSNICIFQWNIVWYLVTFLLSLWLCIICIIKKIPVLCAHITSCTFPVLRVHPCTLCTGTLLYSAYIVNFVCKATTDF